MNFVTLEFASFLLFVLVAGWLLRDRDEAYRAFLLLCNLFFYAVAGIAFVPLLLAVAVLNWGTAHLLARFRERPRVRKALIVADVAAHVCLLAFFKYYEFLVLGLESLASLGGFGMGLVAHALPGTDMLFPVGLSFYTFQGLSYAVDHYRNPDEPPRAFLDVLLFVSFFPTIMAGPILRARQFLPQLGHRTWESRDVQEGFALILSGLFKKVVIASYLSEHIVRGVFESPEFYSSWAVLAAVYAYSIQIFCDFSGYSDMAVGVGRLMGFRLPENFRSPYLALNVQDFWRRWHITLSLWLRDYLYIPLGGSRRGNRYLNLIITMALGGLWHGSHLRFLIWGVMHGVGLAVVHAFHQLKPRLWPGPVENTVLRWCGMAAAWLLTFHFVSLLWIFFRAEDMERSLEILRRLLFFGQPGEGFPLLVVPAVAAGLLVQLYGARLFRGFVDMQDRLPWAAQAVVLALLGGFILRMGPDGVMPFIYFQF
ncbi:MBOAT family O-acyltransferase [uncultured Bilophila sp.]|mgnify:CR=1 FL=1|nr:MBOAT family O-acyltransferase [uncultured Bilophila sp.]